MTKLPARTPWGKPDQVKNWADGIAQVSTARHGGLWVSPARRKQMPEAFQRPNGWYEEDCEWSLVVVSFPDEFPAEQVVAARTTAKRWYPDEYMAATGETLTAEDSHVLAERELRVKHASDYIGVCAWGDWAEDVPKGMVKVAAVRGGRDENYQYASNDHATFLIPNDEYDRRGPLGFIVDEARHQRIEQ
jgi:hypothetical protein